MVLPFGGGLAEEEVAFLPIRRLSQRGGEEAAKEQRQSSGREAGRRELESLELIMRHQFPVVGIHNHSRAIGLSVWPKDKVWYKKDKKKKKKSLD